VRHGQTAFLAFRRAVGSAFEGVRIRPSWLFRRLTLVALAVVVGAGAATAQAATTYPAINAILSEAAHRSVTSFCHTPEEWASQGAASGFDPNDVAGYVIAWSYDGGRTWAPEPNMHYAPGICERTAAFQASPRRETQKMCQEGTRAETYTEIVTEWRIEERVRYEWRWKKVRKKVNGKWVTRRVRVRVRIVFTVEVPVQVEVTRTREVPNVVVCRDWPAKTFSLHVMLHEAGHAGGFHDERQTDCWAMRTLDWFAFRLGAPSDFAREVQADEWFTYSRHSYFDPACVRD
jgi:hypothetical protein